MTCNCGALGITFDATQTRDGDALALSDLKREQLFPSTWDRPF